MRLRLMLAVVALATTFPGGHATAQEDEFGVIAYTRGGDGQAVAPTIYVAKADGSEESAYVTGYAPALAVGESRIAFSQRIGGALQLMTARLDSGDAPRQVTRLPDREGEFGVGRYGVSGSAWSPSRSRIAVRLTEGSTTTLGIVEAEGSGDVRRFEFGHLFGSRIAWRDDESLAVGTDEGLRLVTATGGVTPVKGAAQGDTPAVWLDANQLAVNGADGIAIVDVEAGTREVLLAGATAWDTYLSVGLLATNATDVLLSNPGDGPGTQPSVLDSLPSGAQVLNGVGARSQPILELATGGEPSIWVANVPGVNLGSLGASTGFAAPARATMRQIATGSGLTLSNTTRIGDVVSPGTAPFEQPTGATGTAGPVIRPDGPDRLPVAPGPVDPPPGRSTFAHALPAADEISTDGKALLVNALVTALLMLLITFPSELFNNTLEKHYDEVRGWFGRHGPRPEPAERTRGQRVARFAAYTAAAAVLYALLDRDAAFDGRTARLWFGLVVGIVTVTATFSAASLLYHRKRGIAGVVNVLPGTLVVAVACVVISRVTKFEPGYMYGIVGGFAFARSLPERDEGRAATLSAAWVLAAALVAWLLWLPVNAAAEDGDAGLLLGLADTTLSAIAVGGVQGLVIGLLPLRSLQGHTIARWDRRVWAAAYAVVLFVFVHLLLHPSSGFGSDAHPAFLTWLGLFVGFGVVSVAFWGYFARRPETRLSSG